MSKVAIFIPCCEGKDPNNNIIKDVGTYKWSNDGCPEIDKKREDFKSWLGENVEKQGKQIAINLYDGHLYNPIGKRDKDKGYLRKPVKEVMTAKKADVFIISAYYGIVHAFEEINNYNLRMDAKIRNRWIGELCLPNFIEDMIKNNRYDKVYGFFPRTSQYVKIFESIKIPESKKELVTVKKDEARGIANILRCLGKKVVLLCNQLLDGH